MALKQVLLQTVVRLLKAGVGWRRGGGRRHVDSKVKQLAAQASQTTGLLARPFFLARAATAQQAGQQHERSTRRCSHQHRLEGLVLDVAQGRIATLLDLRAHLV